MIGRIEETSASFEARYAPRSYPTPISGTVGVAKDAAMTDCAVEELLADLGSSLQFLRNTLVALVQAISAAQAVGIFCPHRR